MISGRRLLATVSRPERRKLWAVLVDNNASERALRAAALGRKNFLFVGHDEAGENLAGLYSLIATCEANEVNPVDYLADVMLRVQTHPASRIDELLPRNRPAEGVLTQLSLARGSAPTARNLRLEEVQEQVAFDSTVPKSY